MDSTDCVKWFAHSSKINPSVSEAAKPFKEGRFAKVVRLEKLPLVLMSMLSSFKASVCNPPMPVRRSC